MLITRYRSPIERFSRGRSFDLFNDFLNSFEQVENSDRVLVDFQPSVNTREAKEAYHIEVDLPGIKKEDVDINIDNNVLTISGERKTKDEVKEENYYKLESSYGSFQRSFTLPEKVDIENIKASSQDGILEIEIPKLKVIDSSKKIEIK